MGKYAMHTFIPKAMAEDRPVAMFYVSNAIVDDAIAKGYHPIHNQNPIIDWNEVSEGEAKIHAHFGYDIKPGDFHVRAVIEVKEDHELRINGPGE